jgi:chromosome condensin MukBEF MukE localization factor
MNPAAEAGEQPFHRFGSGPSEAAGKMRASLNRLRRLGMVWFMGHDSSKFRITESVFRFGADVRAGDDPREAQRA